MKSLQRHAQLEGEAQASIPLAVRGLVAHFYISVEPISSRLVAATARVTRVAVF